MTTLNGLKSHELLDTLYDNHLISRFGRTVLNGHIARNEWGIVTYMLKDSLNIHVNFDPRTLTWGVSYKSLTAKKIEQPTEGCKSIW